MISCLREFYFNAVDDIFARKIVLVNVALCWQAIADSHTPASGQNAVDE